MFPTKVSGHSHQNMCAVDLLVLGCRCLTGHCWGGGVTSCLGSVASAQSSDLILDTLRKELCVSEPLIRKLNEEPPSNLDETEVITRHSKEHPGAEFSIKPGNRGDMGHAETLGV